MQYFNIILTAQTHRKCALCVTCSLCLP